MSWRACVRFTILLFTLSPAACGGDPPDKEMLQARTAIAAARDAGATQYAADELTAAETALNNADTAVEQRDYRLALNHALDSRERADNAATQAVTAKTAARADAERAIASATTGHDTAATKLKAAQTARVAARTLDPPRAAITEAEGHLQEARSAYDAGDYQAASKSAGQAAAQFGQASESLDAATSPASRRRR